MQQLPIFPLNTVLFPGTALPLRIFEPRYKEMLEQCLSGNQRFGISLIRTGTEVGGESDPYEIGTVAQILKVGQAKSGVIPIETVGTQRFRIERIQNATPYITSEVTLLDDDVDIDADSASKYARAISDEYLRHLLTAQGEWRGELSLPVDPVELSYFLGTLLLDRPPTIRQALLESDPVSKRLRTGSEIIHEANDKLKNSLMRAGPGKRRSVFGSN